MPRCDSVAEGKFPNALSQLNDEGTQTVQSASPSLSIGGSLDESAILCHYGRFCDRESRARWLGGGSCERAFAVGDFWRLFLDHDFRDGAYGRNSGTSLDSRWLQSNPVLRLRLPDSRDEVPRNPMEKPGMAKPARFAATASRGVARITATGERGPCTLGVGSWS